MDIKQDNHFIYLIQFMSSFENLKAQKLCSIQVKPKFHKSAFCDLVYIKYQNRYHNNNNCIIIKFESVKWTAQDFYMWGAVIDTSEKYVLLNRRQEKRYPCSINCQQYLSVLKSHVCLSLHEISIH